MDGQSMMGVGLLLNLLILLGVMAFVVWLVHVLFPQGPTSQHEDALELAKHRYASGEIGKEEFDRIRSDL
ncbi:MAG: SHOCT domain-containing protein [Deinococcota bacterium]|jgi:uncharacterized membrane protein|nr:SHOCT domain-containing protein [Deinococcota bacterium]